MDGNCCLHRHLLKVAVMHSRVPSSLEDVGAVHLGAPFVPAIEVSTFCHLHLALPWTLEYANVGRLGCHRSRR